jgi:uncharacterized membrane protein YgcG
VKNQRYGAGLVVVTLLAGLFLWSPGCSVINPCGDLGKDLCAKACECGSKCSYGVGEAAIEPGSKSACVVSFNTQCINQGKSIDHDACSAALDAAKCDDKGALALPTECTSADDTSGSGGSGGSDGSSGSSGGGSSSSGGGSK